jgi:hypothetical protein
MDLSGISQAAFDLIVEEEVSSKATYEKRYRHPEWPGGASGITIGIGYDVGYATKAKLHADFDGRIAPEMVTTLERCCGVTGTTARDLLSIVRFIDVPWDKAEEVFSGHDLPQWASRVRAILPNTDKLSPDSFGALVSLAYNRGASFNNQGDRYREMRAIKEHMTSKDFYKIPDDFRSMKRLWNNGLVGRREREAILFERGLSGKPAPLPPRITEAKKSAGKVIAGGTGAGGAASAGTQDPHYILYCVIAAAIVGAIVYFIQSRHKRLGKG